MSSSDRILYLALPETPLHELILEHAAEYHARRAQFEAFRIAYGGSAWVESFRVVGLQFNGTDGGLDHIPTGWRQLANKDYCVPALRTEIGKQAKKAMSKLPEAPTSSMFSDKLDAFYKLSGNSGPSYTHWGGGFVKWTSLEQFGDQWVLHVPPECGLVPEGARELKMSEYWAMKEAAVADAKVSI